MIIPVLVWMVAIGGVLYGLMTVACNFWNGLAAIQTVEEVRAMSSELMVEYKHMEGLYKVSKHSLTN